jgi:hypothetical protein
MKRSVGYLQVVAFAISLINTPLSKELCSQDLHAPSYYGIFVDTDRGIQELTEVAGREVRPMGERVMYSSVPGKTHPMFDLCPQMAIVVYGDEYLPSEFTLYKSIVDVDELRAHVYAFQSVRLRAGPLPGVQGKGYRLLSDPLFEEGDYILQHRQKFYVFSVNKKRELNPIRDEISDVCITKKGSIVACAKGGVYLFDGTWTFTPIRGNSPNRVVAGSAKDGAFFFWDSRVDTSLTMAKPGPGGLQFFDYSIPGRIRHSLFMEFMPRKILDVAVDPRDARRWIVVGDGLRGGGISIPVGDKGSGFVLLSGLDAYELSIQRLPPVNCAMLDPTNANIIVVGTTGFLWGTTNRGEDWFEMEGSPTNALKMAASPDGKVTLCESNQGLMRYDEATHKYSASHWEGEELTSFCWDKISVLASSATNGVFESLDGGMTWKSISAGLKSRKVRRIVADIENPNTLIVATEHGLFKSTDRGGTWTSE